MNVVNINCCSDVWSAGCVLAELMLGQPIFPGDSGVDQLVEIIKVLGTPSREQIREMNPNYQEFKFPQIKAHPWTKVNKLYLLKIKVQPWTKSKVVKYNLCAEVHNLNLSSPNYAFVSMHYYISVHLYCTY